MVGALLPAMRPGPSLLVVHPYMVALELALCYSWVTTVLQADYVKAQVAQVMQ